MGTKVPIRFFVIGAPTVALYVWTEFGFILYSAMENRFLIYEASKSYLPPYAWQIDSGVSLDLLARDWYLPDLLIALHHQAHTSLKLDFGWDEFWFLSLLFTLFFSAGHVCVLEAIRRFNPPKRSRWLEIGRRGYLCFALFTFLGTYLLFGNFGGIAKPFSEWILMVFCVMQGAVILLTSSNGHRQTPVHEALNSC